MGCSRFADAVKTHAAGADLTAGARAHLAQCDTCRSDLARKRRLIAGIDDDLARALRLEPSAEFAALVRARVAAQAPVPWWMPEWRVAVGGASLAVVAGFLAFSLLPGPAATPWGPTLVAHAPATAPFGPAALVESVTASRAEVPIQQTTRRPRVLTARTTDPEVLVPPERRLAVARLLDMLRAGTLDERAFPSAQQVTGDPEQPVPPIVVEDLAVPSIIIRGAMVS